MSDKKRTEIDKAQAAEERRKRTEKRALEKKIKERAKSIENKKKAVEDEKAAQARRERMAARKLMREQAQAAKKAKKKDIQNQRALEGLSLSEFAVTSILYETLITEKFANRKKWIEPSPYEIISYIPGTVISIDVKEGDVVVEGEQLLILEAMKMQNKIDMPFTARIKTINMKEGERIPKNFLMIELEAVEE